MYLTANEYATITGEAAPSDFTACLTLAEALIDGHTLMYYAQTDLTTLPEKVLAWLKQATAYQVQAVSQMGGVAGASEQGYGGQSLGKYSYTAGISKANVLCLPAVSLLPYLMAYARGQWYETYTC